MEKTITYVGLDVHKETIAVALAEGGNRGTAHDYGQIANTPTALKRLVSKLTRTGANCVSATRPVPAAMVSSAG